MRNSKRWRGDINHQESKEKKRKKNRKRVMDSLIVTPQSRGSVDYPSTRGIQVDVGLPDATSENQAESPLYGKLYPNTVPVYTCPKQSNICNIYPIRPLGPINSTQSTYQS